MSNLLQGVKLVVITTREADWASQTLATCHAQRGCGAVLQTPTWSCPQLKDPERNKRWIQSLTFPYPLVMTHIAIEHDNRNSGFSWIFPLKMVIFQFATLVITMQRVMSGESKSMTRKPIVFNKNP